MKRVYRSQTLSVAIEPCLHEISKKTPNRQRLARELYGPDKQPACDRSEARQGLSCIPQGAYGVVGFSRVKDERKGVFHRRRYASARCSALIRTSLGTKKSANGEAGDKQRALGRQRGDKEGALLGQREGLR